MSKFNVIFTVCLVALYAAMFFMAITTNNTAYIIALIPITLLGAGIASELTTDKK